MIEGIRQGGGRSAFFRHNDLAHLEQMLRDRPAAAEDRRF